MPHIHELYDFSVVIYIVREQKVLLVDHPRYGCWLPVGGHVELDEDPEQTLYREIAEETGLQVELLPTTRPALVEATSKALPTPHFMDVNDANPPHKHIHLTYFVRALPGEPVLSGEHRQMRWFSEAELTDEAYGVPGNVIYYCRQALALASAASA